MGVMKYILPNGTVIVVGKGIKGNDGKSAYQYAKDGGYTGTEAEFAEKLAKEFPTKLSSFDNDEGFITDADVPVKSVNNKTGAVNLSAEDVGARENTWMPTAANVGAVPTSRKVNNKALSADITLDADDVGARPDTWTPTYSDVGADKSGTASSAVSSHNTNTAAHNDIRLLVEGLTTRLNALANSTDEDLDQMAEVVAYIKSNKSLIDGITTSKVSVADIVNNLTTNVTNKPLSAAQGVALKALIDAITVPTKVSELTNDSKFITASGAPVQSVAGKTGAVTLAKGDVGLGNVDNVKQYSASNPPPYPVASVNGQTGEVTLDASAVGARPSTWTPTAANVGAVPTSRTVNGKALSSNITLAASDVGALASANYTTKELKVTYEDGTSETVTLVVAK